MSALKRLPARLRWSALLLFAISAAAAALLLAGCWNIFFSPAQETFITLISETAGEICLCDVVVDGVNIPVGHTEVVENSGWLYREQYDNFMIWPKEDGVENRLTLRFYAAEVHIGFPYTPYAGSVTIECSTGGGGTYDLRCAEWAEGEAVQYADFPFDCSRTYPPEQLLLQGTGIFLLLTLVLSLILFGTVLIWKKPQISLAPASPARKKRRRKPLPPLLPPVKSLPLVKLLPPVKSLLTGKLLPLVRRKREPRSHPLRQRLAPVWARLQPLLRPSPEASPAAWTALQPWQLPPPEEEPDQRLLSVVFSLSGSGRRPASLVLLLIVYCLLFFSSPEISPDGVTTVLLLLLTAASYLCLTSDLARRHLAKYRTWGKTALAAGIALYASFASFGHRLFLDGNTRMHVSLERLFYLVLGFVWFIPVIYTLLLALELLASSCGVRDRPVPRRLVFWRLLSILCLCQAVVLWAFWPGGYSTDSINLIQQAVGRGLTGNWHPALNAILCRVILAIFPRAGALAAVQLFFFALLCTKYLMLGYDYGVSFRTLAVLGVLLCLLPNQVIFGITPLLDYAYTLSLLWTAYLLIRLALDRQELWRWQFLLAMSLSLFLVCGFRHNGVVPFIAVLLLFGWITLRHFPQVKLQLAAVSLGSLLLLAAYRGPVFSLLHINGSTGQTPYASMLCAAASCVNKGLPLSEESAAILESVLPLDQWGRYYNRYKGQDRYYWEREEHEYPFDPSSVTAREALTVYLDVLRKYPDVAVKDRLDGMDLLWDVRQPPDGFNTKGYTDLLIPEGSQVGRYFGSINPGVPYRNNSFLAELYRNAVHTAANSVFDMLLWRAGAYLILLLTLALFWWGNRMKRLLWAAVPLLGQLAVLVLALYVQNYRYVAAVQLLTLALAFCSVFLRNAESGGRAAAAQRKKALVR